MSHLAVYQCFKITLSSRRGYHMYHHWERTSIYRLLSYPFRSQEVTSLKLTKKVIFFKWEAFMTVLRCYGVTELLTTYQEAQWRQHQALYFWQWGLLSWRTVGSIPLEQPEYIIRLGFLGADFLHLCSLLCSLSHCFICNFPRIVKG